MRRIVVNSWWWVGLLLIGAVLTMGLLMRSSDQADQQAQQRAVQRQVDQALAGSVGDVLSRERALARVIGTLRSPESEPWPVLANIVTGESVANGVGFVEAVTERDRWSFQLRTGIGLVESPRPRVTQPAAHRPLHLVLVESPQTGGPATPVGLDLAASPVRTQVMLQAARTGRQLATPPVRLLGPGAHGYGVVVYVPVSNRGGRLLGWLSASYRAGVLAAMATTHLNGVRLVIKDAHTVLYSNYPHPSGAPSILPVAGRHWRIWSEPSTAGTFTSSWLVLGLGLGVAVLISLALRQAATRESYAISVVAERDAEEVALTRIATMVAERADPDALLALVAEQVGALFESRTAAVSRFEAEANRGLVLGVWNSARVNLGATEFALDGGTASALVFQSGRPARTNTYESSVDPISRSMTNVGAEAGIAAPIRVAGELWGAIEAAYDSATIPAGAEGRLERFASLVGLAISNADAWDQLARQASTDALTGLANRRAFDTRLASELARARRYERELSVGLLDIDRFKKINDRHGHHAGDLVLVRLAQILSEHAREGDLIARVGGEEFAWIMPETDEVGAFSAVERMRQMFAEEAYPGIGRVTVSVGLRVVSDASTPGSIMRDADVALYSAKANGRNMTVVDAGDSSLALATRG